MTTNTKESAMSTKSTVRAPWGVSFFGDYFDLADEIYEGLQPRSQWSSHAKAMAEDGFPPLTADDMGPRLVASARHAADLYGLPWPAYLPAAEEYALDHPEMVR